MKFEAFIEEVKARFLALPQVQALLDEPVAVSVRSQTALEAIGKTEMQDYPIIVGKEIMLAASFRGCLGQAFTDAPLAWEGRLRDAIELPLDRDPHAMGLFIATLNAVMHYLGLADCVIHCKDEGPGRCGKSMAHWLKQHYGDIPILLVGYQPAILQNLAEHFSGVRILDLNPDNVGQERFGIRIEHGIIDREPACAWAKLILCTGSTVCNGTIADYLDCGREVLFYGTTLSGIAPLMGLKRLCFAEENGAMNSTKI